MSDKAFEYRLGYWFKQPMFEETFTLKDNIDLQKLNIQLLSFLLNYIELDDTSKQSKRDESHNDVCKWCGSENGHWTSIYDWHCYDCGKVTID